MNFVEYQPTLYGVTVDTGLVDIEHSDSTLYLGFGYFGSEEKFNQVLQDESIQQELLIRRAALELSHFEGGICNINLQDETNNSSRIYFSYLDEGFGYKTLRQDSEIVVVGPFIGRELLADYVGKHLDKLANRETVGAALKQLLLVDSNPYDAAFTSNPSRSTFILPKNQENAA